MAAARGFSIDPTDRKSTRLNSSHSSISYAVFCLKKKTLFGMPTSLAISYTRIFAPVILRLDPWGSFYSDCTCKARGVFPQIIAIFVVNRRTFFTPPQVTELGDDSRRILLRNRAPEAPCEARRGHAGRARMHVGTAARPAPLPVDHQERSLFFF